MKIDLGGKRALVTGSSSGIGYAIAKGLAEAGAAVVVHGRSKGRVEAARARLASEVPGGDLVGHAADLADGQSVRALTAAIPSVDILVNNAGPIPAAPFLEGTDDEWQRYQDIYVTAAARLARHYLPVMLRAGWGRILCSAGATCSYTPGDPAIARVMIAWLTSKAALLGLARGLAEIAAGTCVTVNAFIPGPAHTAEAHARERMSLPYEQFGGEYFAGPGLSSVLRRFIKPTEVANLVVFLASEQASAITGATLRVDGGIIRALGC
jgi:NAD(P)-dependent dehydrogenase (short-subunit alcohol dehydrogenase family)